ncbi:hypothetical protein MITSMUL_05245 [Mitsuokella multacida DSM 20544]|uniref:Uncharacterized protein n=1 Tax=Mitsuokella multacida DSM 20544 TaxID=500635 RepID=C9KPT7_9FIRM|nr:hypothetical protein MITSMUL_05245 [Mitsuokella multacida DSM 20544]
MYFACRAGAIARRAELSLSIGIEKGCQNAAAGGEVTSLLIVS